MRMSRPPVTPGFQFSNKHNLFNARDLIIRKFKSNYILNEIKVINWVEYIIKYILINIKVKSDNIIDNNDLIINGVDFSETIFVKRGLLVLFGT